MEYSFVNDPELRNKLEEARKNSKDKYLDKNIIDSKLTKEDVEVSSKLIENPTGCRLQLLIETRGVRPAGFNY